MKDIRTIRRTVATMANQLHKLGYTLKELDMRTSDICQKVCRRVWQA